MDPNWWPLGSLAVPWLTSSDEGADAFHINKDHIVNAVLSFLGAVVLGLTTWAFNLNGSVVTLQSDLRAAQSNIGRLEGHVEAWTTEGRIIKERIDERNGRQDERIVTNTETLRYLQNEISALRQRERDKR